MLSRKCRDCLEGLEAVGELVRHEGGKWSQQSFGPGQKCWSDMVVYTLIAYGLVEVAVRSNRTRRPYAIRQKRHLAP